MSRDFHNVKVGLDEDLEEALKWLMPDSSGYHILRKSVDARQRHNPHFVYSVRMYAPEEIPDHSPIVLEKCRYKGDPVLIIGAGPAGLFAAIRLLERGIPVRLFERGSTAEKRILGINRFWRYGELDPNNNVCFGEGGAGLYSDGKLITRIKSPYIPYVMQRLVQFGAPKEIEYLSNPHVGSDKIRRVIPKIRQYIQQLGGIIHFDTCVTQLLFSSDRQIIGIQTEHKEIFNSSKVILSTGHSAEDIFDHLFDSGVMMEGKSFAIGLRIEHPQSAIDKIQFRQHAGHPKLGAANYKLTHHHSQDDLGVYSFCMCPGGYVLSSGTEANGLVCNGMSNYKRNSPFANSAIVITVDHQKSFANQLFGGLKFRRTLEQRAYQQVLSAGGQRQLPVQKVTDFLDQKQGHAIESSSPSGVVATALHQLLPKEVYHHLVEGLHAFDRKMKGFISHSAQFHGIESRTSCPLRVSRHKETLESLSHPGLFPCGEGAGYAGGITSAACDGIRVAESIFNRLS